MEDISLEVSRIAVPTLVLAGENDNLDSVEQHRREVLSRIANSTLEVIAKSGHLIPINEPEQLASAIARFAAKRLQERMISRIASRGDDRLSEHSDSHHK